MVIDDSKVPSGTLLSMRSLALGVFDDLTHMAWGDSDTATSTGDTTLGNEIIRKTFDESKVKSTGLGTYDFSGLLGLTEANGNTLKEVSLQNASVDGDMKFRALLPTEIVKTVDKDLSVGVRIKIEVVNE